jgi:hypothetical protein
VEEEETDALCLEHQAGGYDTSCREIAERIRQIGLVRSEEIP